MLFLKHCIVLHAIMHCMYQYILLAMNSPCMLICQRCQKTAPKMPILIDTVRNYAPHWCFCGLTDNFYIFFAMSYEDIGTYKYYIFYCSSVPTTRSVTVGSRHVLHCPSRKSVWQYTYSAKTLIEKWGPR